MIEGDAALGTTEFSNGIPIAPYTLSLGIFAHERTNEEDRARRAAQLTGLLAAVKRAEKLIDDFVKARTLYVPAEIVAAVQGLVSTFLKGYAQ
jgi:hypothetical protein